MIERKPTFCRVCEPACGLVATVEDGELVKLEPDKSHPVTKGYACHKGLFGIDIHRDPDRLNHPQRRAADGSYERVSWDEALGDIAARLNAIRAVHGPEAIAGYLGNPGEYNSQLPEAWLAFFNQLGTRRVFNVNPQDCSNKFAAAVEVYGSLAIHPIPDLAHTDFVLILGGNPAVSQMSFFGIADAVGELKAVEARGGRVVFVNPRKIETVSAVGELVYVKPDTDVYLLAAMLNVIAREPGFEAATVAAHGSHVAELRDFVGAWPPARVAGVTGIAAQDIVALARAFACAPRASVHMSTGLNMSRQGTLCYWLVQMLAFVTGNLDREGGNVLSIGYYTRRARSGRRPQNAIEYVATPIGPVRKPEPPIFPYPGHVLPALVTEDPKPVRALVVCAGNPVLSMGGEAALRAALPQLELLVVIDLYRNATGEYAHYLLPATDAFEREDVNALNGGMQHRPFVQYSKAVVAPRAERRHERWIINRLAQLMGLVSELDGEAPVNPFGKFSHMLASRGLTFEELKTRRVIDFGPHVFGMFYSEQIQTADGRVDCCPPAFGAAICRMQAIFDELAAEPAGGLKLITKRDAKMMNSWFANVPRLRTKSNLTNLLYMHPADAAARGLVDGMRVKVSNPHGTIEAPLALTDGLLRGVVAMPHGWGQGETSGMRVAQSHPGANSNRLLPIGRGSIEPLSNQAHMTGVPVEVAAAG
ncbi:MAG: molybdopterin-dependent oxidoreductase [Gammaproteobacteria bacterium]|nr:molybdopterin-dependent oxidoreductase [Gammaproteobacteria bacterium]